MEDFVGSLIGGEGMTFVDVMNSAGSIITTSLASTKEVVEALPFFMIPAAFVFGRKILGMVKSLTFSGGRRRR